ncbi:MAG: ribosome biogenesis GTPase Der [Myxococcales bacterium]|nr:ribosome biogenesis GTPase Der [Myxococcales bacterium]
MSGEHGADDIGAKDISAEVSAEEVGADDVGADDVSADETNADGDARDEAGVNEAGLDDDLDDELDDELAAEDERADRSHGLVAIVGRPNVGKSTLFNRLVGARKAIVEDRPGVTRDRLYGVSTWEGRSYMVVDTGGLDPSLDDGLPKHIQAQAEVAIDEADLILFVVDASAGPTAVDVEIAGLLRRSGRETLVVANKVDNPERELAASAFHELGLGDVIPVSAAHGRNSRELCDAVLERLPPVPRRDTLVQPSGTRIAFMGRPNAGKSTLVNALFKSPRVIVDATAGTTRDPIELPFEHNGEELVLIDTAGLRRRKQIARAMEKLAAIKAIRVMERTQIVVLVIDATAGVTDQDQRLARMAFTRGKGVVVLLHKWDLLVKDKAAATRRIRDTEERLNFLERPFILKTSVLGDPQARGAGAGKPIGLNDALGACLRTAQALRRRLPTAALNEELAAAVAEHPPPMHGAKPVRLLYATQAEREPPLIVISANHGRSLQPSYERYLLRRIRRRWSLRGIPVRIVVRARGKGNRARTRADEGAPRKRSSPRR